MESGIYTVNELYPNHNWKEEELYNENKYNIDYLRSYIYDFNVYYDVTGCYGIEAGDTIIYNNIINKHALFCILESICNFVSCIPMKEGIK